MELFRQHGGRTEQNSDKVWKLIMVAAAAVLLLTVGGCTASGSEEHRTEEQTEAAWTDNILMSNPADVDQPNGEMASSVFRTSLTREEISSVTFLDTLEDAPEETVDISQAQDGSVLLWTEPDGERYDLFIAGEGGVAAPEDCTELFAYYSQAERFSFNGALHTTNTVIMHAMFKNSARMTQADVETFDTAQVTDMSQMFEGCRAVTRLDVGGWDTGRVETTRSMFFGCDGLTSLDLNKWDTGSLTDLRCMFQASGNLTDIGVSSWDVSQSTQMGNLFKGVGAEQLDLSGWDMSNVVDASEMFQYCRNLTSLIVGVWDLSGADTEGMFENCAISAPTSFVGTTQEHPETSLGGTQVAAALASAAVVPEGAVFPDLASYAGGQIEFEAREKGSDKIFVQSFSCDLDDYALLEAYVDMLVEDYDFQLAETPYYQHYETLSGDKTYFDFLLNYTGPETLTGDRPRGFNNEVSGDIRISGSAGYHAVSGSIVYNNSLSCFDNGLRYGSSAVGTSLAGASAAAGLVRLSDGTYQTTDGRLKAGVGEAAVSSGGDSKTCSARFQIYSAGSKALFVEDSYGTVRLRLSFPSTKELESGMIMTGLELADDHAFIGNEGTHKNNSPLDSLTTFYALHNETYYSALPGLSGEIRQVNVRIMYWQEKKEAVFHIGVRYDSAPQEEEYLIAVSIDPETQSSEANTSGDGGSNDIPTSDSSGSPLQIRCTFIGCSNGKVECSACDGKGGRRVYDDSTPQYDGVGSNMDKWDWETCYKCGGSGETKCSRCGGDGWIDAN